MTISKEKIIVLLKRKGLKVTPQRLTVYEAVINLQNHPTAEQIIDYIKVSHPEISVGTVYKILDTLVDNDLLKKVKSEKDVMRYDAIFEKHHHLYCIHTDRIEDYQDPELDALISQYFKNKNITGFNIQDITLQITGEFKHT